MTSTSTIDNKSVVAFVPIKFNNERLPNKNILCIDDKPLISYILNTLKKCEPIQRICVFCSDEAVKKYLPEGVEFIQRDSSLDENFTKGFDIYSEFIKVVDADVYVLAHATSPCITSEKICEGIQNVVEHGYESSISVKKLTSYCYDDKGNSINFKNKILPRTQDLDIMYLGNSAFYIFRKDNLEKYKSPVSASNKFVVCSEIESIDIDYLFDFNIAKYVIENKITE
jgi:CMP-N-acetylneuraminic acid synthetase